jgi:two-component sensor histidine kinase
VTALLETIHAEPRPGAKDQLLSLVETIEDLSAARTNEEVAAVVRTAARRICGADGVSFVLRDGEECCYLDEDAIGPLWKGRRFPMGDCISGWAMLNGMTAVVPDIREDERIPQEAYRPTFVRSLVMTPVRVKDPIAAIGAYWAEPRAFTEEEVARLEVVARATATALENVRLIASLEDALADRDHLIRELDHRVKNSLASVRAIAQQTLRSAASPEAFNEALSDRLMALSRAQDLISAASGDGVPLEAALREGVGDIDPRVSLEGPEVRLAAETAVNVLMGVQELASNARRHGALSATAGSVRATWAVRGGQLELDWCETGGPPVRAPERRGFGLRMMETALPRSLGGSAVAEFYREGLRYRMSAPLSKAIQAA